MEARSYVGRRREKVRELALPQRGLPLLSLVLPAHNEAKRLEKAVESAHESLKGVSHEILIAQDGSTDGTAEVAKRLESQFRYIRAFSSDKRLGRGKALCMAFQKAKGEFVGYMDVDLSTDPTALKDALTALKTCEVVTGSRYLPESFAKRSLERDALSVTYNQLVRTLLGSKIKDHQCGFKFFRKHAAIKLCQKAKAPHWFWDTEVLVLAQKEGLAVAEIPVSWVEKKDGSKVRVLKDSAHMFMQVIRLWKRLRR